VTYGENGRGVAEALAHGNGSEYVGGWFDQTGSVQTNGIARWDGSTWHSMGSGLAGGASATGPSVDTILVYGNQVFIGGDFSSVNRVPATDIAVYDGSKWSAVGHGVNANVDILAMSAGYLYAGGSFPRAGGKAVGAPIARWKLGTALTSTSGWSALGPLFAAGGIGAIAFDGPYVFVGGNLQLCVSGSPCDNGTSTKTTPCETATGFDVNGLMVWDKATPGVWYYPFGCGVTLGGIRPGTVNSLWMSGTTLYVGGYFDHAGIAGVSPNSIAAMNIASLNLSVLDQHKTKWSALGTGVGAAGDRVASLTAVGKTLYVGGAFSKAGGLAAKGVAQWNIATSKWSPLGSGLGCVPDDCTVSYANAVDAAPNGIFVAGNFGTAGGKGSDNFARWVPPAS
jgi:hypothetical protein